MKNIFAICLAFIISFNCFSQSTFFIVSGRIVDKNTNSPLQSASVFAQNTTLGTATDANGNFKLWLPTGGYDLVVTFTGYDTESKRITASDSNNNSIVFAMGPKEKSMESVAVIATNEVKDGWEKYGNFFTENFIGKTPFSKQCFIENPDGLKFFFSKKRNRLKIKSDVPLEIKNDALGYRIKYNLDSFVYEYNTNVCVYTGFPLFEEMQSSEDAQQALWKQNRAKAYKGSILHFMKAVYSRSLKEEGFEVQFLIKHQDVETAIPVKDIYGGLNFNRDDSTGVIEIMPNQQEVAIMYKQEGVDPDYASTHADQPNKFQLSVLTFPSGETIVIEPNGYYYDQNDITLTGYWDWEKVANMLPYDFKL